VKRLLCLLFLCGCVQEPTPEQKRLACECFSQAAYDAYRIETLSKVPEIEPQKCCKQCGKNGLPRGKMLSGDRQSVVACPCPDTCECKTSSCVNGACKK
jgi:hypothetical protein